MRTGVVLELKDGRAVVLDGSGGFREVSARTEWRAGDVVPLPGARTRPGRWAGLAACLVLLLLGGGGWLWLSPAALVSLDVNPSVELTLNRFDRVLSARAMNDEGFGLLDAGGVKGMTADAAVSTLLGSGYLEPYLERENAVTLTVQSGNAATETRLLVLVDSAAGASVDAGTRVSCHGVDRSVVEAAHGHGVTAGKYLALMELQEADPEIDISEYAHCGIGEIEEQTERCHTAESGTGVSDAPADGASAGCGQGGRHGHGH